MNSKFCTNTQEHTSMLATTYCYVQIFTVYQLYKQTNTHTQMHTYTQAQN